MMNILEVVELGFCEQLFLVLMGHEWRLRLMNARVRVCRGCNLMYMFIPV